MWISTRHKQKDCTFGSPVFPNLPQCPQLFMGQQEACMDWPVLALGFAKPDLLAQSKCPQVVFLSLEWN